MLGFDISGAMADSCAWLGLRWALTTGWYAFMSAWWFRGALVRCGRPRFEVQVFASPLDLIILQQLLK